MDNQYVRRKSGASKASLQADQFTISVNQEDDPHVTLSVKLSYAELESHGLLQKFNCNEDQPCLQMDEMEYVLHRVQRLHNDHLDHPDDQGNQFDHLLLQILHNWKLMWNKADALGSNLEDVKSQLQDQMIKNDMLKKNESRRKQMSADFKVECLNKD